MPADTVKARLMSLEALMLALLLNTGVCVHHGPPLIVDKENVILIRCIYKGAPPPTPPYRLPGKNRG